MELVVAACSLGSRSASSDIPYRTGSTCKTVVEGKLNENRWEEQEPSTGWWKGLDSTIESAWVIEGDRARRDANSLLMQGEGVWVVLRLKELQDLVRDECKH
jgi:hypothetical protein